MCSRLRGWWAEWLVLRRRMCPRIHSPEPSTQVDSWSLLWSGESRFWTGQTFRLHIPLTFPACSERWVWEAQTMFHSFIASLWGGFIPWWLVPCLWAGRSLRSLNMGPRLGIFLASLSFDSVYKALFILTQIKVLRLSGYLSAVCSFQLTGFAPCGEAHHSVSDCLVGSEVMMGQMLQKLEYWILRTRTHQWEYWWTKK